MIPSSPFFLFYTLLNGVVVREKGKVMKRTVETAKKSLDNMNILDILVMSLCDLKGLSRQVNDAFEEAETYRKEVATENE